MRLPIIPLSALPLLGACASLSGAGEPTPQDAARAAWEEAEETYESGNYLEFYSPTDCKLFSRTGKLLANVTPQGPVPILAAGDNVLKFNSGSPAGVSARANVTVINRGKAL